MNYDDKIFTNQILLGRFSESIKIVNQSPLFELLRLGETLLLINGKAISAVWHDMGYSSFHYYFLKGFNLNKKIHDQIELTESLTKDRISDDTKLERILETYKPLLQTGFYRIFYSYPYSYSDYGHYNTKKIRGGFRVHFPIENEEEKSTLYLGSDNYLFTKPVKSIDDSTVNQYEIDIKNGKRPTIITLGINTTLDGFNINDISSLYDDSYPQYIIDGHHKTLAYLRINDENKRKGYPHEVLVPGIFHIVKVQHSEIEFKNLRDRRKKILVEIFDETIAKEIIEYYDNW